MQARSGEVACTVFILGIGCAAPAFAADSMPIEEMAVRSSTAAGHFPLGTHVARLRPRPPSTGRSPARPARWTRTPTPGLSASIRT